MKVVYVCTMFLADLNNVERNRFYSLKKKEEDANCDR